MSNMMAIVDMMDMIRSDHMQSYHGKFCDEIGCPIMMLKNLDAPNGVCNGSKGILTRHSNKVLEVRLLTGQ